MNVKASLTAFVLPLDAAEATLELVGGKGASLARLVAAGLPVPPGFHITTAAYKSFIAANNVQEAILSIVAGVDPNVPSTLEDAASRINALFVAGSMPDEIVEAISQAYAQMDTSGTSVAVRSSATAEDLPEMSFAGQQETYLNISGQQEVLAAVKRCWASLWTARAIGYRARHNIDPADVSLAVVVQELVPADASGILFTANPLTGASNQVMINAAWGLGEAIVGGVVTPDTVVVAKADGAIITQEIADKEAMTVRTAQGTQEEPVPAQQRTVAVLSAAQAAELARLGQRIEELYGVPMDIEWAMHAGQFFIVQARPITALPEARPDATSELEWKLPNAKGHYYRSSVIELLPDPLSPLFTTLGLPAWNKALMKLMSQIGLGSIFAKLTTINGYAYYDFSPTPAQSALMVPVIIGSIGTITRALGSSRQRWEQMHSVYIQAVERWEAIELHAASATALLGAVQELVTVAADYYLTIQGGILPVSYMSEAFFTLVYDKLLKRRGDPPALTYMLGYDSAPIQAEKSLYDLAQWVGAQAALKDALQRMSREEFSGAYQSRQATGVDEAVWSGFCQRFAAHIERFGHTIYDLDFMKPVPEEDPAPLLETLKYFLGDDAASPYERQTSSMETREQAVRRLERRSRGPLLSLFRKQVQRAQRFAPLREDALSDVGLGWPLVRHLLHEIGQRVAAGGGIASAEDVFWLTHEEVQAAVHALDNGASVEAYQASVAERRGLWKRQQALIPPVFLPVKGGVRFWGIDFSDLMPARSEQATGDVIKGVAASPGRVTGTARVIHGPHEFDQMRPGDILVARITTPAWTPLFALAGGVITDVGGPLSHSSIVAREYHIPAVLGTGSATERIQSGQQVTVDGDAGTVKISDV
jgi:pyruvate,water dikinase